MSVSFPCANPQCGKPLRFAQPLANGASVRCPHCRKVFCPIASTVASAEVREEKVASAAREETRSFGTGESKESLQIRSNADATRSFSDTGIQADEGAPAQAIERIGRFVIRRKLGEGAFGNVYEAHDPQLDRAVALKVAKLGRGDAAHRIQRFLREAKVAANLRHPHIVPLYEYGQDGEQFYIASAFIRGSTLQEDLATRGQEKPDLKRGSRILQQMAEALGYAHAQGIVHRDLKPANTMLDGNDQPLVMDFGLATRQEEAEKLTHAGQILGTPRYMSPEQARGDSVLAQPASDQYSLGVMLYEMIVGKPPFEGTAELVIFHQVETEAPSPRKENAAISRDLETICLKCLEKDPAKRYADCHALAEDLRRFQEDEPILARRIGSLERFGRWARKNRLTAALIAGVAATLVLGTIIAWGLAGWALRESQLASENEAKAKDQEKEATKQSNIAKENAANAIKSAVEAKKEKEKADDERRIAVEQKKRASDLLEVAKWRLYASQLAQAESEWQGHNASRALAILWRSEPLLRHVEFDYLHTLFGSNQRTFKGHLGEVHAVAWSPDGKSLISGDSDKTLKLWDAESGKELRTVAGHATESYCVVCSPDGKRIVSGGGDGTIKVFNVDTGQELHSMQGHTRKIYGLATSPDGKRLVSGSWDRTVKIWDAHAGKEIRNLEGHTDLVLCVAWSSDGKRIASASADKTVRIWNAETGETLRTLEGHKNYVMSVSWSPDSKHVVTGSWDNSVKIWDTDDGKEVAALYGHRGDSVLCVAWSPDGSRIASGGSDKTVKVWDAEKRLEIQTFKGHAADVIALAWCPEGKRIASGSKDYTIKVWEADKKQDVPTLVGHEDEVHCVAWDLAGNRLVSGGKDSKVLIWDADKGEEALSLEGQGGIIRCVAWSPDGTQVFSGSSDKTGKIWDVETGRAQLTLRGNKGTVKCVAWSPDGSRLATGCDYEDQGVLEGEQLAEVKIWNAKNGQCLHTIPAHTRGVLRVEWSPDGKRILSFGRHEAKMRLWDGESGKLSAELSTDFVVSASWSEDGKTIYTFDWRGGKVWDVDTGKPATVIPVADDTPNAAAWSHDGRRVVFEGKIQPLALWGAENGQELIPLKGHTGPITAIAWTRKADRIATASADKTIRIWGGPQQANTTLFQGPPAFLGANRFSIDGKRMVYCDATKISVWDLELDKEILTLPLEKGGTLTCAAYSRGGKYIAAGVNKSRGERAIHIWNAEAGTFVTEFTASPAGAGSTTLSMLAWSPDGKRVAGAFNQSVQVWDALAGRRLMTLKGQTGTAECFAWSPDGKRLVFSGAIWDGESGKETLRLKGYVLGAKSVAWSPDGKFIAAGGPDAAVRIWDAETGTKDMTLRGHLTMKWGGVHSLAWSPDGKRLLSAGSDQRALIWTVGVWHEAVVLTDPGLGNIEGGVAWSSDGRSIYLMGRKSMRVWTDWEKRSPIPMSVDDPRGKLMIHLRSSLSTEDPKDRLRVEAFCHSHEVNLLSGKTYEIAMKSKDFDAFLRLEDEQQKVLAEDDNGGEGKNARILFSPVKSGIHRVIATHVDATVGHYTLEVREIQTKEKLTPPPAPLTYRELLHRREWRKAADALEESLAKTPPKDLHIVHQLAALYVLTDQKEKWQATGAKLIAEFETTKAIEPGNLGSRTCAQQAGATVDMKRAAEIGEEMAKRYLKGAWLQYAAGLIHYRAGNPDLARSRLEEALKCGPWVGDGQIWLVLALLDLQAEKRTDADSKLRKALEWQKKAESNLSGIPPNDWLEFHILLNEYQRMVGTGPKKERLSK